MVGIFSFFRKGKKKDSFNDAIKSQLLPEDQLNIEQLVQKEVVIEKTLEEQKSDIERRIMAIQRSTKVSIHAFERWHNDLRSKYKWYYKWHVNPLSSFVHWVTLSGYTASMAAFVLSYLFTTAVVQIYAASAQTWGSQSGWSDWQLSDTSLDNNVLKLSTSAEGTYVGSGSATLAFTAPDGEVVDWLSTDSDELLSGATIAKEFSTDNILFTDKIENLADSSNLYIKVGLSTSDASVTPILNSLSVHYSRLPYSPDSPAFKIDKTVLGAKQILKGGVFADPDGDQHKASQWQIAKSSGDYANAFLDTGSVESKDPADLTSFTLPNALDLGTYYFRVRYQDTTGAWGLWSKECAFKVEDNNVALNVGTDTSEILSNQNEEVANRTETTKTIDNKDGTKTLESYSGLIHYKDNYQDPASQWKDINSSHSIDNPEYVLFDQMPSTVKVFKDKIGYEIESRKTGDKYTVELESLDGTPKLSRSVNSSQFTANGNSNRLVSWADINTKDSQPSAVNRQPLAQWLFPHALAQDNNEAMKQSSNDAAGNLKFEFEISESGVRLWKTITGPDAPKNFAWNITKTDGTKDTTTDDLKFRENPDAFEVVNAQADTTKPVEITTEKTGSDSSFTWTETAPQSDLKIDTDVTYYAGPGDGYVVATGTSASAPGSFTIAQAATDGANNDYTGTLNYAISQKINNGNGTYNSNIYRAFLPFDTSALPDDATVSAATLSVYLTTIADSPNDGTDLIGVVQTTQPSNTALTNADFDLAGTVTNPTLGATAVDITGMSTATYNNIALDATGIGWISLTGYTKLGLREAHDYTLTQIIAGSTVGIVFSTSEETGTGQDPKLAITYTLPPAGIDISGTFYDTDESTTLKSKSLGLRVNGGAEATATSDVSTGAFTFSTVAASAGDTITIYSKDGTSKANTITITDGTTAITGANLYASHVAVRSDNSTTAITNADIADWDNDNDATNMLFTDNSSNISIEAGNEFYVFASKTYTPGGTVTVDDIDINGTFVPSSNAVTVSGSWDSTDGTFTNTDSTVTFTSTTTETITSHAEIFNNLTFNGSGGTWTAQDALVTAASSTLTITDGTLDIANQDLTIGASGTFTNNATLKLVGGSQTLTNLTIPTTAGTVEYSGTGTYTGLKAGNTYYHLKINGSGEIYTLNNDLTVSGDITLTAGTLAGSTYTLNIAGSWTNNGGTFTKNTSTVNLNGQQGSHTITANAQDFYNLTVAGADVTAGWISQEEDANDWLYRKTITLNNTTGGTLTNFQVPLTIDTSGLTGKLQSACQDLRFTPSNSTTPFTYWYGSGCLTSTTQAYILVPSLPNGTTDIYMYYGNATAASKSNGETTFIAFEDFATDPGVSLSDSNRQVSFGFTFPASNAYIMEQKYSVTGVSANAYGTNTSFMGLFNTLDTFINSSDTDDSASMPAIRAYGGSWSQTSVSTVYDLKFARNQSSLSLSLNGSVVSSSSSGDTANLSSYLIHLWAGGATTTSASYDGTNKRLTLHCYRSDTGSYVDSWIDDVRLRTYASADPAISAVGNEFSYAQSLGSDWTLSSALTATNNLTVSSGTLTAGNNNITTGNVIQSGGTFTAPSSSATTGLTVNAGWNHSAGTFTHNSGTVTFTGDDLIQGSTTFNNFTHATANKTITVTASTTQTIAGTLSINGTDASNKITLVSSSPGTRWNIAPQGTKSVSWVTVSDSDSNSAINATNSTEGTPSSTTNWLPPVVAPTVTTQSATDLAITTATGNGNITATGGANATEQGFKYGLTEADTWSASNAGDFGTGAYTKGLTGLSPNVIYHIRAYATNSAGTGYGSWTTFNTLANVPSAPTVDTPTVTSLKVTVNANSNPAATEFAIYNDTAAKYVGADGVADEAAEVWQNRVTWGGDSGIANTGLSVNTQYTYTVKARNGDNTATAFSSSAAKYTLANVPSAPTVNATSTTSLTAIINANSNPATTEFAISCDSDSTFLNYTTNACEAIANDADHWRTYANWGGASGFVDTGLSTNTSHIYKVEARNGDNTATALSSGTSKYTLANTPALTSVVGDYDTSDLYHLDVTINANGNPAGTNYYLQYSTNDSDYLDPNAMDWQTATTYIFKKTSANADLAGNTQYWIKVKAKNGDAVDTGYSGSSPDVTPPAAPGSLNSSNLCRMTASTSWGAATGANTYTFSYGTDELATNLGTTADIAVTNKDLTGLTNNTTYYFKVSATSSANGTGAYSGITSFATTSCIAPTAPSNFAGSPASTTQINWSWTDTADDETAWNVHNTSHSSVSGALAANTISYNETPLSINTAYTRHVNVSNGSGNNDSNQVTVYTLANAPSAPTVAATSSSSIKITVNKNSNPEATTRYAIAVSADGGATWAYVKNSDGTTQVSEDWQLYADWGGASGFVNTGLTAAKEYTYKVKARNGDSVETAFSATAAATSSNPTIQFTSATGSGAESTTAVNIAVSIPNASATDSSVDYAVSGGTATGSGTDYTLASGTATITAGSTSTNIAVTIVNDTLDENDETVIVTISNPTNATLGASTAYTYTITDDDTAPTVAFTLVSSSGNESSANINLEVSISAVSGKNVTADYAVTGGTATGSGTDYTLASGTATITAGNTTTNIALTVVNDTLDENDETVIVTLSNPSNSSLGSNTTHTYTILDDDVAPTIAFTATSSNGSEATTPVNLELTLSTVSGRNVIVDYAVSGGTATGGGVDYTLASGTATITAGSTTTNVALTVVNDTMDEDDETVIVTISNPTNATLGVNSSYTYIITDNDNAPTIAFASATGSGAESVTSVNLEVSLSVASSRTITVDYAVTGGTATGSGTDYTLASGTATIAAGSTTTNVALTIVNDLLVEIDETVIVTLSNPTNATLGVNTDYTYTMVSEDVPPTGTISINAGAARSNSTTFALTLSSSTASEMKISGAADLSGASYEAYAASKSFTLSSGDGTRTVYVKFKDAGTNESEIYSDSIILDTTGPSAPTSLVAVSGSASISLSWTNPSASDFAKIAIFRSTTAAFTANISTNKIANTENSTTATYTDSSVTNGVAYYYQIKALDNDDNYSIASAEVSGKPDADNPTTPGTPTISAGIANQEGKTIINSRDVTLAWTAASDPSSGLKGYYVSIGTTSGGSEIVANKEILISSLTDPTLPSTLYSLLSDGTYYVRIQAKDNLGNISANSGEFVFIVDTTAPALPTEALMYDASNRAEGFYIVALTFKSSSDDGSGLKGYVIAKNGNPILDNTDKNLTDKVASDSVSGYSSYIDISSADAVSSYSIKAVDFVGNATGEINTLLADTETTRLTGQTAGSKEIKLASSIIGEGQLEISDIISSPSSLVGKKTQAKITWKTTVPSSTQVEYGQSSEYASKTELDTGLNSTHTAILSELLPATTYHYRVISKDKYGNEVASPDQTFITNQPVQDESVLELIIDNLSQALSGLWSGIKGIFSLNPDYSLAADSKAISKLSVANISTEQRPAYIAYWPLGKGNVKVERSENGTSFVTLANTDQNFYVDFSAKAKVDYTYRVYGESAVISEESGGKAVISDIKTEAGLTSADEASVIITFQTDALAKSQISYGESAGYGADTELDNALNQSHTMLIEKLKPKTLYHFKVRTTDKSDGNISESEDNTFVTADAPVDLSLLQLIIKSLSDAFAGFGNWMGS